MPSFLFHTFFNRFSIYYKGLSIGHFQLPYSAATTFFSLILFRRPRCDIFENPLCSPLFSREDDNALCTFIYFRLLHIRQSCMGRCCLPTAHAFIPAWKESTCVEGYEDTGKRSHCKHPWQPYWRSAWYRKGVGLWKLITLYRNVCLVSHLYSGDVSYFVVN